jgi:hypothetical protein
MAGLKKIIARLCLLTAIIALLNICYEKTFWKKDLDNHADMLWELLNQQDHCDVLYFGESSDFHADSLDRSKKSINEFTADYFPSLKFGGVSRPAMHAGIFLAVIKHLSPKARVKTVVFTMNLRSFGAAWINSDLESYLQKTKVMYQPYPPIVNRFLYSLNVFENKTDKQREKDTREQWSRDQLSFPYPFPYKNVTEWNKAMANGGHLNKDGTWNKPKIDLACHYIKSYAFQINPVTNPRIKDFDEIVKVCKGKNLNIVFNLLAENIQYADSLVGKELVFLMRQNRSLLIERYSKMGVRIADNLEALKGEDFIDQDWTTEHYKEQGRRIVATKLAEQLKELYPDKYKSPEATIN